MSVIAVIRMHCHAGKGGTLEEALAKPIAVTKENPDCPSIELFVSTDSPDELLLIEEWSSEAAHHKHVENLNAEGMLDAANSAMASLENVHYTETGL